MLQILKLSHQIFMVDKKKIHKNKEQDKDDVGVYTSKWVNLKLLTSQYIFL